LKRTGRLAVWKTSPLSIGMVFFLVVLGTLCLLRWGVTENLAEPEAAEASVLPEKPETPEVKTEATAPLEPRKQEKSVEQVDYTVRKGDCLWTIARAHGTTVKVLAEANGLNPDRPIHPGQRLRIPPSEGVGKEAPANGKSEEIIRAALAYEGVRYRYGGMSSRGFDCSGLVARVLLGQGIRLPHNSAALFRHGQPVAKAQLWPGDLVFFRTGRRAGVSHVGIYLGEGEFIHASSGKGRVRIDSLLEGYYSRRYVGARRIASESPAQDFGAAEGVSEERKDGSLSSGSLSGSGGE